jgi:hypothetical protein
MKKKKLNRSCHIIKPLYLDVESYKFIPAVWYKSQDKSHKIAIRTILQ